MKKRQTWIGSILVAGVALVTLLGPAGAQQEGARRGDSQKPVVTTYDKAPQPPVGAEGDAGSRGDLPGDVSDVSGRPATTTTPTGDDLGDDPSRADGRDDAPGMRGDGRGSVEDESPRTGDSVKTVLPTYTRVPEAQNPTRTATRPSDLSNIEEPSIGDSQKPTVTTYDKRPDPKGEAQDFDAIRFEERNEANDGQSTELRMRVLEGSVIE